MKSVILNLSAKREKKKGIALIHFSVQLPNVCRGFLQSTTSAGVNQQSAFDFGVRHQWKIWLPGWLTEAFKMRNEVRVYQQLK